MCAPYENESYFCLNFALLTMFPLSLTHVCVFFFLVKDMFKEAHLLHELHKDGVYEWPIHAPSSKYVMALSNIKAPYQD